MSEQATEAAFPVGTRVRERAWPPGQLLPREGVVVDSVGEPPHWVIVRWDLEDGSRCLTDRYGEPPHWVIVRWDGSEIGTDCQVRVTGLERIAPPALPRAPERVIAPGIVQSDDTCDGRPRLAGTRMPTRSTVGWKDYAAFSEAHPHVTSEAYTRGVLFEAGIAWERERRRRRKERRLVRRYERAKALTEGAGDGE